MSFRKAVLVLHLAGQYPMAGIGWQALHYLVGLRRLGYDVYYVEDSGANPYDPRRRRLASECSYSVEFLARTMAGAGLGDRWAYRDWTRDVTYGLGTARLRALYREADALLNVCGATRLRDEHRTIPVRIYVETDPGAAQIRVAEGHAETLALLGAHTHHATYGENLGEDDCPIPLEKFSWTRTRPPVVLDLWPPAWRPHAERFTTVASWENDTRGITFRGETYYWSKHLAVAGFADLPRRTGQPFEMALDTREPDDVTQLEARGWRFDDAYARSRDLSTYQAYIQDSRGEFTVAKDLMVRGRTGWFSDRSVCYLAAGKPVVTQETGFSRRIPSGRGLFGFSTLDDAVAAIEAINGDYAGHCRAARDIAAEYFDSDRVLGALMRDAGL
jgi:hypothetical protein